MDNTVGSLTQQQISLIYGCVLGDGYIRTMPGRKDAFLEINHSIKAKEYVDFKYSLLKNICKSPPKMRIIDDVRAAYRFTTIQHKEITRIHELFYKDGRKIVPRIALNPFILAIWFMDDGSKSRDADVYLNTQQFSVNDQKKLLAMLRAMKLKARLNRDKKYYRVRFLKESIRRFNKIVDPYIVPSMRYKLSYDPVET